MIQGFLIQDYLLLIAIKCFLGKILFNFSVFFKGERNGELM